MLVKAALIALGLLAAGRAGAQSFDCSRARSPQERAICTQPGLGALDRSLAEAFAAAMGRAGDGAAALHTAETAWVRDRDARCTVPARMATCLSAAMTARIAALSPPAPAPAPQAQAQARPAPPPAAPVAVPSAFDPPAPAAALDRATLPAGAPGDTLLRVTVAGRFALAAHSATGTAIQLIDMMSGPAPRAGEPGVRDGRTDVLLDVGTYKLRVLPAAGATGEVQLAVTPFRDAAAPVATSAPGTLLSAALADVQSLAFWTVVGPDGRVEIDAAGRALADLRLWRGGTDLEPLAPAARVVEAVRGHPMLRLRLSGTVEPGTYLVTAYGGPALAWADGASDMPFLLRAGTSPRLREGWAAGTIGPMGSEAFAAPARAGLFRLTLPAPAAATLAVDGQSAAIAPNSRDPSIAIGTAPGRRVVEVTGLAGQAFTLRAQEGSSVRELTKPGRYFVSATVPGAGGDEVPPTLLLSATDGKSALRVLASSAPRVGPGLPWRAQFNVRGPTTLLLQNTAAGQVTVRNASQNLATLDWRPRSTPLPAGFAEYLMAPPEGRQGVVDLTFGGPATGPTPAAVARWPADPVVPLGVQTVEPGQRLVLDGNTGPLLGGGLLARPVPVALAEGPLVLSQMPGVALDIPVRVAAGGTLGIADPATGDLPIALRPAPDGTGTVSLPAPDAPRTVVLSWRADAAAAPRRAIPAPPRRADVAAVGTDAPAFLDLARGEGRRYDLTVAEGGLYRIETLGRLHTGLELGTAFMPALDHAEANGIGANALLQRWLRAGRYRVAVRATESAGHLALRAAPAPMADGAPLLPGGSVRATLPAGTGLSVPVTIAAAGRYRLSVQGLGRTFNARLDDAEGWPLTPPGPLDTLEQAFAPGDYRLLVSPEAVDAALVARLDAVVAPVAIEGHGPHPLVPGAAGQDATWREPAGRDDPRVPDDWTFRLAGPAEATLRIGAGMVATLERDGRQITRVAGPAPATLTLPAGAYHVLATSLGRNDRLAYRLSLATVELQPGVPRRVEPTAQVPFALADASVVSLTTSGTTPLKAVLRDGQGGVIGRYGNRADDWNVAVSRVLPAGRYRLDLSPSTPPDLAAVPAPPDPPAAPEPAAAPATDTATDTDTGTDDAAPDATAASVAGEPAPQTAAKAPDTPDTPDASPDASADAPAAPADDAPKPTVEVLLSLPTAHDPVPAPSGPATLAGGGVHRLTLPPVADGQLVVATATSPVPLVLALERQGMDGAWVTIAQDTGRAPIAAADGRQGAWRMAVWPVDGGALPMTAAAAVLDARTQPVGAVVLRAVEGAASPLFAAAVQADAPGPVALPAGLRAGGWPGHALAEPSGGLALPQEGPLWLVARTGAPVTATVVQAVSGTSTVLAVPHGAVARLAAPPPAPGVLRAWRAESGLGQPGLDAGGGMGVAPGGALAAGTAPVRVWDAGAPDGEVLRPRVTPLDLKVQPPRTLAESAALLLPPLSATHLTLPAGDRRTDLSLAAGVAALAGPVTVWTGGTAEARSVPGDWTDLVLLNTSADPASAAVAWTPGPAGGTLRPGAVVKRFFGASGSFDLAVEAPAGVHLRLVGDADAVWTGADGQVRRGAAIVPGGPGRLTVRHAPGPVALWLDGAGSSPWPAVATIAGAVPGTVALSGPAMALALPVPAPVLLHARTTAPVILRLDDGPPTLYPAGASLARYVARPVVLRIDSPQDGPLSGTLEVTADPVIPVADGLGAPVALAPGGGVAFAFRLATASDVGVGVRADPDRVAARLLAADGTVLGEGVALLRHLAPGRYLLEASLPPDAPAAVVRAAVVGIAPRPSGPPPDVAQAYLELVGLAPQDATR